MKPPRPEILDDEEIDALFQESETPSREDWASGLKFYLVILLALGLGCLAIYLAPRFTHMLHPRIN